MDSDIDNNILSLAIEIRGIKTKKLLNIKENDITYEEYYESFVK